MVLLLVPVSVLAAEGVNGGEPSALADESLPLTGYCGADGTKDSQTYDYGSGNQSFNGTYYGNAIWTLAENGTLSDGNTTTYKLTITGSGAIGDFKESWSYGRPWHYALARAANCEVTESKNRITEIEIADGITEIGAHTFEAYENVPSIVLPDSVTRVGKNAFNYCTKAASVDFSVGLKEIGDKAFSDCDALTSLSLPNGLEAIGASAFGGCDELAGGLVIPDSVTAIGSGAFSNDDKLSGTLTIGGSVKTIGDRAFSGCKFTGTLVIPDSVTSVGESSFNACKFNDLALGNGLVEIGKNAFYGSGDYSGHLSIPDSVKAIGESAFSSLGFSSVHLGKAVETIGASAFINCTSIHSLDIASASSSISYGDKAFNSMGNPNILYVNSASQKDGISGYITSGRSIAAITNGGAFASDTDFTSGTLASPAKEGRVFAGWYTQDGTGGSWGENATTPDDKEIYYAKWVSEVAFDANGGAGTTDTQQIVEGDSSATLAGNTFTRTGYTFAGWNTSADGEGTAYADGASASGIANGTTLYAQWKANTYTISFDGGEGATGVTASVNATYNKPVALTANGFSKTGYKFEGWDTDSSADDVVYSDATQVENLTATNNAIVTLYAVWGEKPVLNPSLEVQKVTYNGLGQAFNLGDEFNVTYWQDGKETTPRNAGTYDVVIHADETDEYAEYNATVYGGLVIEKAALTITPNNMSAYVGDAVPTLDQKAYKIEGLCRDDELEKAPTLSYESTPDMTKPGSVKIVAAGAEASDNYEVSYGTGTLTVSNRPVTPPSSSDKTEVEHNQDGSTTTTVTKPDGSQTITHETATGTESVVAKDKDGNVISTEVKVSKKDAESGRVELPIEGEKVSKDLDDAVEISIDVPTSVTADKPVQVTVPIARDDDSEPNYGVVVFAVDEEGNETVIPKCAVDDDGNVVFEATGNVVIKVVDAAKDMPDVTDADWFAGDVVDFATARGIVNGVALPDGSRVFNGYGKTSRGMFVAMLHNLESNPEAASEGSLADVPSDAFYADAAAWALEEGILSGVDMPGGTKQFQGNADVTREQVAVFLMRYAGCLGMDVSARAEIDFPDAGEVSGFAKEAMSWAVANGLFTGDDVTGELNPTDGAARAEVAAVLMRFINLMYA